MNYAKQEQIIFSLFDFSDTVLKPYLKENLSVWELREHFFSNFSFMNNFNKDHFPSVHFSSSQSIHIGENVIIYPGALIEGPCYIGDNAIIGHSAYIRSGSIICKNALIGHASEINRSILLKSSKAAHFNYVGDSIIGNNVNLGAHATLANLRLDQNEITVRYQKEKFQTNQRKLGSFIGDGSFIGCNSVLNPGTVVQKHSNIPPLTTVRGYF